jgi:hypothetical protein
MRETISDAFVQPLNVDMGAFDPMLREEKQLVVEHYFTVDPPHRPPDEVTRLDGSLHVGDERRWLSL